MVTSCSSKHLLLHCSHGECLQLGYASPVDVARGVSAKCTRSPNAKRVRKGVPLSDLHIIIYCHIYWYNTAFFSQGMPNIGALALRFLRDRIKRLCWHVDTHPGTRAGTESGRCRAGCCSFQVKIQRMPGRGLESPPHCWHRPLRVVGTSVLVSTSVALCGLAVTLSVTPEAMVPLPTRSPRLRTCKIQEESQDFDRGRRCPTAFPKGKPAVDPSRTFRFVKFWISRRTGSNPLPRPVSL